jgi:hypothetical protein
VIEMLAEKDKESTKKVEELHHKLRGKEEKEKELQAEV